jgi:hypothetical protein
VAGRIRTIKPEILDDEKAAGLSDAAWRLWVSSWLLADDYGRLRANTHYLKGSIFWHERHRNKKIDLLVRELEKAGLLTRYSNGGQKYALVPKWDRHQKVQHPGKPRCPEPLVKVSGKSHEGLAPDHDHDHDHDHDPLPEEKKKPRGPTDTEVEAAASFFIEGFNKNFSTDERQRRARPETYLDAVRAALRAGYNRGHLRAAQWAAAQSCIDRPDILANFEPTSILRLSHAKGGRCLKQWVGLADEMWDDYEMGERIWLTKDQM